MHCAYACSPDGKWIAATWTDSEGELLESHLFTFWTDGTAETNAADSHTQSQPLSAADLEKSAVIWERVLADIWNYSCHISSKAAGTLWRIIFCRLGAFTDQESKAWAKVLQARNSFPTGLDTFKWGTTPTEPTPSAPPPDMASALNDINSQAVVSSPGFGYVETGLNVTSVSVAALEEDTTFQAWSSNNGSDMLRGPNSWFAIDPSPRAHCACSGRAKSLVSAHVMTNNDHGLGFKLQPLVYSLFSHEDTGAQGVADHPLSSSDFSSVLSFLVQQFDAMSWLTTDPVSLLGRRSNLPFHCVVLARFVNTLFGLFTHAHASNQVLSLPMMAASSEQNQYVMS